VDLTINDFDKFSASIPLLANLQPSGKYFMEDLYYAGGLPAVMKELLDHLHGDVITANGRTIRENVSQAKNINPEVISTVKDPLKKDSGIVILKGNLCLEGAVVKPNAASSHLMKHSGKAVVFENIEDYKKRIDDPSLDVDENSVLVLKNVGPRGYPGMPEVGNMGLPKKLLEKGITDMVRISDGRMSGTGFGTVVLHVSPEAAAGGNFSVIESGDLIELDIHNRTLNLAVPDEELMVRKQAYKPDAGKITRGYAYLYVQHVEQAHLGADFDFLKGGSGSIVTRDSH
jgi:dihydroxy-acid dehydratase